MLFVQGVNKMWFIAKTKPNQEYRAEKNLINQGFKCFLPSIKIKKLTNSQWVEKKEVLFTSYIFIRNDSLQKNIATINNTYGVSRLLTCSDTGIPHLINDKVIRDITSKCKNNRYINNIKEGNKVICRTAGAGLHGIFKEFCGKNRAKVLLKILNKSMEIVINKDLIQKIL